MSLFFRQMKFFFIPRSALEKKYESSFGTGDKIEICLGFKLYVTYNMGFCAVWVAMVLFSIVPHRSYSGGAYGAIVKVL